MPYERSDSVAEDASPVARILSAVETRAAGVLGVLTVVAVVALPHPLPGLPGLPAGAYAAVGVAEGVGLAVAAENLVHRPVRGFDRRRAARTVGLVVAATATFVGAMVALGVDLDVRDRALLAGFAVAVPTALAGIDYLKARVAREVGSRDAP